MIQMGDRLRELRGKKTQAQVARDLNMPQSTYSLYEQNQREPQYAVLVTLADFYGVTTDYLLGRNNIRTTKEDIVCVCQTLGMTEENAELLARAKKHPFGQQMVVPLLNKSIPFLASVQVSYAYSMIKSLEKQTSHVCEEELWELMEEGAFPPDSGYVPVTAAFAKQAFARQIAAEFAEYLLAEEDNDAET